MWRLYGAVLPVLLLACLFCFTTPAASSSSSDLTVSVDTDQEIRQIRPQLYGNNMAAWDKSATGADTAYNDLMLESGMRSIRYPGGSWSDKYIWDQVECGGSEWKISIDEALQFIQTFAATLQPVVNFSGYWCGRQHSQAEAISKAAEWVEYLEASGQQAPYWEVGNEIYGEWETGHTDGTTYGSGFADFYQAMKEADPTIKIGADAVAYDQDWQGYDHFTTEMLAAANEKGVVPDFLVVHSYASDEDMNEASDAELLQAPDEIAVMTDNLNSMVSKTLGEGALGKIEYWMSEYRSAHDSRIQTVTFLDTLFTTQYLLEMANHGWAGANLWNMKNGVDSDAEEQHQGDYGFIRRGGEGDNDPANTPRPTYYLFPYLTSIFGQRLVETTDSEQEARSYAATDSEDRVTVVLVNNSGEQDHYAELQLSGFEPASDAESWTFTASGQTPSGEAEPIQERTDIAINGVVNPDPTELAVAPKTISLDNESTIPLPASSIVLLRLSPSSDQNLSQVDDSTVPFAATAWPTSQLPPLTVELTSPATRGKKKLRLSRTRLVSLLRHGIRGQIKNLPLGTAVKARALLLLKRGSKCRSVAQPKKRISCSGLSEHGFKTKSDGRQVDFTYHPISSRQVLKRVTKKGPTPGTYLLTIEIEKQIFKFRLQVG